MISIGSLSNQSGVKIPTIRYYETEGIISAPSRSVGNQRRYTSEHLTQLNFVKHARSLGFSIDAIRDLITLSSQTGKSCADADVIAKDQLIEVRDKITKLKKLEKELNRIATTCDGKSVESCYVIQALADHKLCSGSH